MAKAFMASVPLAIVLVASLVVPLAVIPGTFGFDRWPSSHGPRVSERQIQLGQVPVVEAQPAPAEPLRRSVPARAAVAQTPVIHVRQVATTNTPAPVIAHPQSAGSSPARLTPTPAAPAPQPKPPHQPQPAPQPQPEPQVAPQPAQAPQTAKTGPNVVAREQVPHPATAPAPEPTRAPEPAPPPPPVERVEGSPPSPGNGDASGDQGRGTQD